MIADVTLSGKISTVENQSYTKKDGSTGTSCLLTVNAAKGTVYVKLFGKQADEWMQSEGKNVLIVGLLELVSTDHRDLKTVGTTDVARTYYRVAYMKSPQIDEVEFKGDGFNAITLVGKMGKKDPVIKVFDSGKVVVNFSMVVDGNGKGADGSWFEISAWDKTGDVITQWVKPLDQLRISGRIESTSYTNKNGEKKSSWRVTATGFGFGNNKKSNNQPQSASPAAAPTLGDGDIPF